MPIISFYEGPTYTPATVGGWVATRDLPWNTIGQALDGHGKGQQVDHTMTAEEALKLAGLDFDVKKVPVADSESGLVIPKLFATYRDDETVPGGRHYYAGVSDKYEPVRPSRALSWIDEILFAHEGTQITSAWDMREKSQMGVTVEFPEKIVIDPGGAADTLGLYGLGWNSFDGTTGLGFGGTTVRFWCLNQLTPTIRSMPRSVSLRHTKKVTSKERVAKAREAIGVTLNWAKEFDKIANRMFNAKMNDNEFMTMLGKLAPFHVESDASDLIKARIGERIDTAMAAWKADNNANITGTHWGAYNVMTEWADWGRTVNGSSRTGASSTRQRAIGTMVGGTVGVIKKAAWELSSAGFVNVN